VAILDVRLPDGSGIEVCRELRVEHPHVRCLMLTSFDDDEALFDAIVAGASGYVLKEVRGGDLVDGVHRAAGGIENDVISVKLILMYHNNSCFLKLKRCLFSKTAFY
jgi:DNA-binding NarL/FixJ family response regulator